MCENGIRNKKSSLVFTSVVLSPKHGESEKSTGKVWENKKFQGQVFLTYFERSRNPYSSQNLEHGIYLVRKNYGKTQIFQRFQFLIYSALLYFAWNRNTYDSENMGNNRILIVRETYGKTQTFQSYGFLTNFICGINTYNSQNMRKVNPQSKESEFP